MSVIEVVDGEVVDDTETALVRRGLDLSDAEQARELERRIEQMGVDGDTGGLVAAEEELSAFLGALRAVDRYTDQMKTLGILRIKTWAELGGMDDLEGEVGKTIASEMRGVAAVQERGRLPELIAWAQTNDRWALRAIYYHGRRLQRKLSSRASS